jgi:hypothetical protein
MNNFKIDVFLKKHLEYILLNTFEQKTAFSGIYLPKRVRNRLFFQHFYTFWESWKTNLTSMTFSTTTPGLGAPPANSRRTKQFWSRPRGL